MPKAASLLRLLVSSRKPLPPPLASCSDNTEITAGLVFRKGRELGSDEDIERGIQRYTGQEPTGEEAAGRRDRHSLNAELQATALGD